jgi:squalene monooxygenase
VDAPVKIDMPVSKYLRQVLPFLPHDLQASFENALSSQKPQMMPNTILNTAAIQTPGLLMIGDAWNMRHPFTGGGMTVGLWDIVHLKHSLSQKHPIIEDALISYRFRRAFCINVLSQALYLIFASTNSILVSKSLTMIGQKERFYLKIGCLKYFELGGDCIRIPIGILSG